MLGRVRMILKKTFQDGLSCLEENDHLLYFQNHCDIQKLSKRLRKSFLVPKLSDMPPKARFEQYKRFLTMEIDLIYLIQAVFAYELRHNEDCLSLPREKTRKNLYKQKSCQFINNP